MDLTARKNKFIESFEKIKDASLIERFEVFLNNELASNKNIAAYTTDGKPLNQKGYRKEIEKGIDDIKSGRTISDSDLAKEIEIW